MSGWNGERTASSRVTSTYEWQKLRDAVLQRDGYQCQAQGPNCIGYANEVDHERNVAGGGAKLDPANARAICSECHKPKTQAESRRARNAWKRQPERHPGLL